MDSFAFSGKFTLEIAIGSNFTLGVRARGDKNLNVKLSPVNPPQVGPEKL